MGNTTIPAELVAINAIQGTLIADNAITAVHIGQNQVHSVQLAINSVTATQIADSTITSAKIQDGTIVTADIAAGQITTAKIADDAVTQAKIGTGAVVASSIANGAITSTQMAANSVSTANVQDNAISLAKMAGLSRGSIIYGDSAGNPAYLSLGAANTLLQSDGTDLVFAPLQSGIDDNSNAVAITIDSSENVGIGPLTSPPDSRLHVFSGVSSTSDWGNLGVISDFPINNAGRIYTAYLLQDSQSIKSAAIGHAYDGTGYKMHFGTASSTSSGISTALTIDRLGKVGIGTPTPVENLSIVGTANTGMNIQAGTSHIAFLDFGDAGDTNFGGINYNNNDDTLNLRAGNLNRLTINSLGNVGIGTSDGDVTNDNTSARTYVSIIGSGNRGRLNLGSTASSGADAGVLAFTNGANTLADIVVDTTPSVQNTGTMYINGTRSIKVQAAASDEVVFNEGSLDVDFRVESDGNANMLFVDGANNVVCVGGTTVESADHFEVLSSDTTTNLRIRNTHAGSAAPALIFDKASSSPADDDEVGLLNFVGQDSSGNAEVYGQIVGIAKDITAGTEDGIITIGAKSAGTYAVPFAVAGTGVGVGTTDPDGEIHVKGLGGGNGDVYVERTSGAKIHLQAQSANGKIGTSSNHNLGLNTNATTQMTIDTSGNTGFGTVPSGYLSSGYKLRLYGGTQTYIAFNNSTHTTQVMGGFVIGNDGGAARITQRENQPMIFSTNNLDRMQITASGGLEVGDGTNYGYVKVINDSAVVQYLDRRGSDGTVLEIRHADSKDGQINTLSGRMAIGSDDTGVFFDSTRDCISPFSMTQNDGRGNAVDIGRTGIKFKDIHLSGDVFFGDNLHFNAAADSSFIGPSSTSSIKYAADGEHIFQTYNGAWGTVLQVQDTGLYTNEGNYDYHTKVPEFSQHSVSSYSSSTNVTYNEATSSVPAKGEKLVAVSAVRAYTNYVHFKTNLNANNIMHYFRTRGYFYGSGMEEKVHGAYTYNNTVISLEHQSVYGGGHTLTVYKSSDGYLVLRLHANQQGYTEGKVYVYFSAHSHQVTRELQITSVIQRDDGNNAF